jgi:hypothetical protein
MVDLYQSPLRQRVESHDMSKLCNGTPWLYCQFSAMACCHLRKTDGKYECQKYGMWMP